MQSNTVSPKPHFLWPVATGTNDTEQTVMGWIAAGHEMLWIPIFTVDGSAKDLAEAQAEAKRLERRGPFIVRQLTDLFWLPVGIPGWLFPAHLDDTDVVCQRDAPRAVSFGHLTHPVTGQRLTYRYDTEAPIRRQSLYCCTEREL